MVEFVLLQVLLAATGAALYLIARALPRIEREHTATAGSSVIERWIASEIPDRLDEAMNAVLEKTFRKIKVFVLRIDNILTQQLKRVKPDANGNGKPKIDFKDMMKEKGADAETARDSQEIGSS